MTKHPTPDVSSRYGAPMGRHGDNLSALCIEAKDPPMTLQRIRINSGGYDNGGAYWGLGEPLFWWSITITEGDTRDECSNFIRAKDRAAAKAAILKLQPNVKFLR